MKLSGHIFISCLSIPITNFNFTHFLANSHNFTPQDLCHSFAYRAHIENRNQLLSPYPFDLCLLFPVEKLRTQLLAQRKQLEMARTPIHSRPIANLETQLPSQICTSMTRYSSKFLLLFERWNRTILKN